MNIKNKHHSLREIRHIISQLSNGELPRIQEGESARNYLDKLESAIGFRIPSASKVIQLQNTEGIQFPLYRVRECESIRNINLVSNHSNPPPNLAGLGRCNMAGYPVFYAALNPIGALVEVIGSGHYHNREYCIEFELDSMV